MQLQLNLGLKIPQVRLEIDYNDRRDPYRVKLQQEDMTFSKDGKTVTLQHKALEKLCRQVCKIAGNIKLSISYMNEFN